MADKDGSSKDWFNEALNHAIARGPTVRGGVDAPQMDNNAAERALRTVPVGRKNYLFAGSDSGGERAAAIYSLLGSAKLNGVDPEAYTTTVLRRIADHPINRIAELLPWKLFPTPSTGLRHGSLAKLVEAVNRVPRPAEE